MRVDVSTNFFIFLQRLIFLRLRVGGLFILFNDLLLILNGLSHVVVVQLMQHDFFGIFKHEYPRRLNVNLLMKNQQPMLNDERVVLIDNRESMMNMEHSLENVHNPSHHKASVGMFISIAKGNG